VVEDNPDLRRFLRLQLEDDFRVEETANGKEGLARALKSQPDIILSDVMMPEMDGIEMLDKIKNDFETSHIPVVLLTARSSVESRIEGLTYGADAYLTKPFDSLQLKAQLENLLRQRSMLRAYYSGQSGHDPGEPASSLTERDQMFLEQVREQIGENLSDPDFRVARLYAATGMGRSKFFDKLKGLTGLSPIDFIREVRLNKARDLLRTGQYNVAETAFLSGFSDAGYFGKCFRERYGVAPSTMLQKTEREGKI